MNSIRLAVEPPDYGYGSIDLAGFRYAVSFDTETYLMPEITLTTDSGRSTSYMRRKAPRLVCASLAGRGEVHPALLLAAEKYPDGIYIQKATRSWRALLDRTTAIFVWHELLKRDDTVIIGHYIAFDISVMAAADPTTLAWAMMALAEGRITDVKIREMLIQNGYGKLKDDDKGGKGPDFSLAGIVKSRLHRDIKATKTGDDVWRLRYHELDGIPLHMWPQQAIDYPLDDAEDTLLCALDQAPYDAPRRTTDGYPVTTPRCGVVNEAPQVRADLSLSLMGAWGLRVDAETHELWGMEIEQKIQAVMPYARAAGIIRPDGTMARARLQQLVFEDYKLRIAERAELEASGLMGEDAVDDIAPLLTDGAEKKIKEGKLTREDAEADLKNYSTEKEVLIQCEHVKIRVEHADGRVEYAPVVKMWGETAFMLRMRSTYYEPSGLGIFYAMLYDFNVLVSTGRTSGRKPNKQNPPRKGRYREQFVARKGRIYCSVDYSAVELCTLAQIHYWVFGSSKLRDAINAGEDPHAMLGAKLAGVSYEEFKSWLKKGHPKQKIAKSVYRQVAKIANFGLPGGMGAAKFVKSAKDSYDTDLAEVAYIIGALPESTFRCDRATHSPKVAAVLFAKHLIREWKEYWTEAPQYMDLIGQQCRYGGDFTFIQPISQRARGGCGYCDGNNSGFQGLAADGAKAACWLLSILCYLPPEQAVDVFMASIPPVNHTDHDKTPRFDRAQVEKWARALYGVRPVLFVHDEVIAEGPEHTADQWARAMSEVMVAAMRMYTPDVKISAEPALMYRWYKAADPIYIDGVLVPWEPWIENSRKIGGFEAILEKLDTSKWLYGLRLGGVLVDRQEVMAESKDKAIEHVEQALLWQKIKELTT